MEIFFTSVFAQFEAILVVIFGLVILLVLATYAYEYIARVIKVFWPNKRDAKLEIRDIDVLKKREENEEKEEDKQEELPPPITLEEIEEVEEKKEENQWKEFEEMNISGDADEVSRDFSHENASTYHTYMEEKIEDSEKEIQTNEVSVVERFYEENHEENIEKTLENNAYNTIKKEEIIDWDNNESGDFKEFESKTEQEKIDNISLEKKEEDDFSQDSKKKEDEKDEIKEEEKDENKGIFQDIEDQEIKDNSSEGVWKDLQPIDGSDEERQDMEKEQEESLIIQKIREAQQKEDIIEKQETEEEDNKNDSLENISEEKNNDEKSENFLKNSDDSEIQEEMEEKIEKSESQENAEKQNESDKNSEEIEEKEEVEEEVEKTEISEIIETVDAEEKISEYTETPEEKDETEIFEEKDKKDETDDKTSDKTDKEEKSEIIDSNDLKGISDTIDSEKQDSEKQETEENKNQESKEDETKTEEKWEKNLENPENVHKTFEEIEKESDDFFPKSEIIVPEKEEKVEPKPLELSERTEDLLNKSYESIREIIEEKAPKKPDPHIEELFELTNQAKTFIARGLINEARSTIVRGLALRKDHRDLNILLGEIFETEGKFDRAEIIYRDLALAHTEDEDILRHLANNLIITKKTSIAYEIYKKILTLHGDEENTLYMLANIARELEDFSDVYQYSRQYLKNWPMDKDMLSLLSESQIILGKRKEAIETLVKLKNLSPYDAAEIQQYIDKLITEEEMSKNFSQE